MHRPYFINPDIERLPEADGDERRAILRHIAACVGDEATLRGLIGMDPEEFKCFYPDMNPPELSTDDTITSFIGRFSSEKKARTPQIESLVPVAPAVDYASMLDDAESAETADADPEPDATADAISAFLAAVPPKTPSKHRQTQEQPVAESTTAPATEPVAEPEPADDVQSAKSDTIADEQAHPDNLSETLFKLMVRNKNDAKALEIITELSLNNPKKSVYFAYQIRFLKKLIKNQAARPDIKP